MPRKVLIIGEDPSLIDFSASDAPPNMSARKVMDGLDGSRDRLVRQGFEAAILLTRDAATVEEQVTNALRDEHYDVAVVGAGLRTLPRMAEQFERLINVLHSVAPTTKIAFNSGPDDSDTAALRWLKK
jgi:hypothetical protein